MSAYTAWPAVDEAAEADGFPTLREALKKALAQREVTA